MANEEAVLQFAQRYAPDVLIPEPEDWRNKIANRLKKDAEEYEV